MLQRFGNEFQLNSHDHHEQKELSGPAFMPERNKKLARRTVKFVFDVNLMKCYELCLIKFITANCILCAHNATNPTKKHQSASFVHVVDLVKLFDLLPSRERERAISSDILDNFLTQFHSLMKQITIIKSSDKIC